MSDLSFDAAKAFHPTRSAALAHARKKCSALRLPVTALQRETDGKWLPVAVLEESQAYLRQDLAWQGVYPVVDTAAARQLKEDSGGLSPLLGAACPGGSLSVFPGLPRNHELHRVWRSVCPAHSPASRCAHIGEPSGGASTAMFPPPTVYIGARHAYRFLLPASGRHPWILQLDHAQAGWRQLALVAGRPAAGAAILGNPLKACSFSASTALCCRGSEEITMSLTSVQISILQMLSGNSEGKLYSKSRETRVVGNEADTRRSTIRRLLDRKLIAPVAGAPSTYVLTEVGKRELERSVGTNNQPR